MESKSARSARLKRESLKQLTLNALDLLLLKNQDRERIDLRELKGMVGKTDLMLKNHSMRSGKVVLKKDIAPLDTDEMEGD